MRNHRPWPSDVSWRRLDVCGQAEFIAFHRGRDLHPGCGPARGAQRGRGLARREAALSRPEWAPPVLPPAASSPLLDPTTHSGHSPAPYPHPAVSAQAGRRQAHGAHSPLAGLTVQAGPWERVTGLPGPRALHRTGSPAQFPIERGPRVCSLPPTRPPSRASQGTGLDRSRNPSGAARSLAPPRHLASISCPCCLVT